MIFVVGSSNLIDYTWKKKRNKRTISFYEILNYDKIDCNNDLITKALIFSVFSITMVRGQQQKERRS